MKWPPFLALAATRACRSSSVGRSSTCRCALLRSVPRSPHSEVGLQQAGWHEVAILIGSGRHARLQVLNRRPQQHLRTFALQIPAKILPKLPYSACRGEHGSSCTKATWVAFHNAAKPPYAACAEIDMAQHGLGLASG